MPAVKLTLTDEEYQTLQSQAKEKGLSIQDYILKQLLNVSSIYIPEEAVKKALRNYEPGEIFTLPELYGDEWDLEKGKAGSFGKRFNEYISAYYQDKIEYMGKIQNRAQYRILLERGED